MRVLVLCPLTVWSDKFCKAKSSSRRLFYFPIIIDRRPRKLRRQPGKIGGDKHKTVRLTGIEPATLSVLSSRSNQLIYNRPYCKLHFRKFSELSWSGVFWRGLCVTETWLESTGIHHEMASMSDDAWMHILEFIEHPEDTLRLMMCCTRIHELCVRHWRFWHGFYHLCWPLDNVSDGDHAARSWKTQKRRSEKLQWHQSCLNFENVVNLLVSLFQGTRLQRVALSSCDHCHRRSSNQLRFHEWSTATDATRDRISQSFEFLDARLWDERLFGGSCSSSLLTSH